MSYRNGEGYADPTAEKAINNIRKEEKEKKGLEKSITDIIDCTGYELVRPLILQKKKGFIK